MGSAVVYVLCAATSLLCAVLLLRGYWKNRLRLLLWSGLCFIGLALDNIVLIIDVIVLPQVDLTGFRQLGVLAALIGLALLLFGLVWDAK